jgi:EAL and modified HD-GYP domain-containing signal transduction protein
LGCALPIGEHLEPAPADPAVNDVLVARRPVFDRSLELAAYEIVVAADGGEVEGGVGDTVSQLVLELTGDGDVDPILGDHPAWLRLSATAARAAAARSSAQRRMTIEVRPDATGEEGLLEAVTTLRRRGYAVAVDATGANGSLATLVRAADVATVDVAALAPHRMTSAAGLIKEQNVTVAATGVQSPESYEAAREAGFDLFRGEFFKKPAARTGEGVAPGRLAVLRLLGALQNPAIELAALGKLLSQDVGLSYRLLRYINSAYFGVRREVTTITHALSLLGLQNVKRWATVMMLADVDHQPRELLTTALVRARFCELVGPHFKRTNADHLFTLGLFSVLDALMDTSMAKALRPLPLNQSMIEALTLKKGPDGKVLSCALAAERAERAGDNPVDGPALAGMYREALAWGTETATAL